MKSHLLPSLVLFPILAVAADLPPEVADGLYKQAKSQPGDRIERLKLNASIVEQGRNCLADHPEVPPEAPGRDLLVRRVMLPAARRLFADEASPENRARLLDLANEVASSPLWEGHQLVEEKVGAAELIARLECEKDRSVAETQIRGLVDRYPLQADRPQSKDFHGQALVGATRLAVSLGQKKLADEFCPLIATDFLATAGALDVLAAAGHPALLEGEMTTLDGKTLRFPDDAKGKVLVLDFWATWCGPCVASLPHIREVRDKFKDKEVWIIGVGCDSPTAQETPDQNKKKVEDFVKAKNLDWTQTYAGQWPPLAVKYGVGRIPTVMVVGKDGRILSASARGQEERLVLEALGR